MEGHRKSGCHPQHQLHLWNMARILDCWIFQVGQDQCQWVAGRLAAVQFPNLVWTWFWTWGSGIRFGRIPEPEPLSSSRGWTQTWGLNLEPQPQMLYYGNWWKWLCPAVRLQWQQWLCPSVWSFWQQQWLQPSPLWLCSDFDHYQEDPEFKNSRTGIEMD